MSVSVVNYWINSFQSWIRGSTEGSSIPKSLNGKVAAITGSTSGIGKAIAEDLVQRGAKVLLLCRNVVKVNWFCKNVHLTEFSESKLGFLRRPQYLAQSSS